MSFLSIWFYAERALRFALPAAAVWAIICEIRRRCRREPFRVKHFLCSVLFAAYLAALVQIIVIRDWADFFDLLHTDATTEIIWVPFRTTLRDMRKMGVLWECYHIAGNMVWFMPLGFLGAQLWQKLRSWRVLPIAAFSVSFLLEFLQWLFQTGVSDVDDLILNTLGGCIGFALWRAISQKQKIRGWNDDETE